MAITQAQIQRYIAKAQRAQEVGVLSIVDGKRSGKKGDSLYYPMRFLSAGVDVLNSNHGLTNLQVETIIQEMIEQGCLNDFSGDPVPYQTIYIVNPNQLGMRITDLIDGPGGSLTSYPNWWLQVNSGGTAWSFVPLVAISVTTTSGITAFAGGGQGSATQLTTIYNYVDTVAANGDSVKMSLAVVNNVQEVQNDGANDLDIFPAVGESFYGSGINVAFLLSSGQQVKFVCANSGVWRLT